MKRLDWLGEGDARRRETKSKEVHPASAGQKILAGLDRPDREAFGL